MSNIEILRQGIEDFGIEASDKMLADFQKYKEILVEWNQKMNLTGIEDEKEVFIKHFLDSISAVSKGYIQNGMSLIDVGTGAGFPGMPLRISLPELKVTLLDSLNKRINFLQEVANQLDIDDIEFIHGRAEDMEFCVPFVKVGGHFVCLKGPNANLELEESKKAMEVLGVEYIEKIDIKLPEIDLDHNILVFKKVKNTPSKYPRKAGKVTKNPIK